ncbi:type VI secretion system Vgr family protein [Massilia sp. Mn16-1_5]|uniref:type VI secretion system Vgr family protein n=1 Tax=Massilia sp. Mn16-1_5 TaxID=2079199 RepID=UPI00109E8C06|nr:type VI secretion system Vgr family protein [Massilia sp. Mn16-1_5]THC45029.1 type VI secretion system tip protein VgrG [Massilia sp. Mn16-1_5]
MNAPGFPTLGLFGTGLSQHARLITLETSQDGDLPEALAAEAFSGREAVNELFRFDVDALSTSTDLDIDAFIGAELTLGLLQPDGSRRAWHGLCLDAAWLGADGGVARYRLRLEPALALLSYRRDSWIFQDRNVRDIVTELLADYPQIRFDFDISQDLPARPICTQYRESDLDFFVRLLASEGLSWRFEHEEGGHRLVIFDSRAMPPATPGNAAIRFHGVRATERDDAIDSFSAQRRVAANGVAISSWDPAQLVAPGFEQRSNLDAGDIPPLWLYDGSGERIASGRSTADTYSELMLQALELDNKRFEGTGAARRLAAGHAFQLTQHERYPEGENAFTVLWVQHEARNNFDTGIVQGAQGGIEKGTYRNRFGCVRDTVAIVPALTALPSKVTAPGAQCALVVGLPDAVSTTTRDHQVRVQFAWQRGARPNAGGLAHDTDSDGCAPGDERSGTWVRVAEALAGANWGTLFTPRIGTEVLVDFIEGDIDRPVIVAQLFTGSDLPPFPAGVGSSVEHPGTLSGIHSHNFDGGGFNQWQLDDTQEQLRTRLATSTASTQLNLGYLIQQAPGSAQRGAYRGSGFELRTDAWAVVRGGEGVLLSTSARSRQGCGVTSTQMDAAEAVSLLKGAQALGKTLGDAAAQQQALFSANALKAQAEFIGQIDPKEKGKFAGAVNGQAALKARNGSRELDAEQPVEKFGSSLVLMDSAASINWATPASTLLYAGRQLHWTTQSDLHMAAAHTVSSVAGGSAGLFTHAGGIQAIAGNGPLSLQAHTDALEILADKEITVISVNDCIEIKAKQKIVLQAGQSAITLEGGDITFACPGKFSVKGGKHLFDKGSKQAAELPHLPDATSESKNFIALNYRDASGEPMAGVGYKIKFADGVVISGKLDQNGNARHDNVPEKPICAEYEERTPLIDTPWEPLKAMLSQADKMFTG